jgi:hypothetical protein
MTDRRLAPAPASTPASGRSRGMVVSEDVWARIEADYRAGLSAPSCARRHGVGVSTLRRRAAEEGWRRMDQPWRLPEPLDPDDAGLRLDEAVDGDLRRVSYGELAQVARQRMKRAVLSGHSSAALRWRRVAQMLTDEHVTQSSDMAIHSAEALERRLALAHQAALLHPDSG